MKVAMGNDHGAVEYKDAIKAMLEEEGIEVIDCGTNTKDSCDYPDYAKKVADLVVSKEVDKGIVICGTGIDRKSVV